MGNTLGGCFSNGRWVETIRVVGDLSVESSVLMGVATGWQLFARWVLPRAIQLYFTSSVHLGNVTGLRLSLHTRASSHSPTKTQPFLAETLPASVKVSNLSEYNSTGDPQEHLDKFYTKIDWYDLSDAAYRKKENEPLKDYVQRFVEAVHEVPHGNHELLACIMQQNLLPRRFKESIAGKPPTTMEDLLGRSQKYIRIEESNVSDPSVAIKRNSQEEEKESKKKEERKHNPTTGFTHYTP
ncbi:UNVERIFIED_CONTAM: hypothetical protein Slati_3899400 [Sesamum latifolium]|uniref:Retrotransposon gag domain-containing protein n=1 Tax=Sesamum latifolium TaxID=2727402 RepID=A0AAW2TN65_9LAMI